ncbi:hypothetical protein, partial [Adlercreutzia sp. DFI.6.23]|uniref:hypothetical protein n=1 Tax=Adlercreutzia sp. DFI.6.23 TaxID=2963705 RepID=UPI00210B153A
MFEFLSSPFGLVAVGLGVLAVAVLALCLWITTLDRRMRGMADDHLQLGHLAALSFQAIGHAA